MARSPLLLDITPIKRQPGTQQPVEIEIAPPEGSLLESAEVTAESVALDLLMEFAGDQLVAAGTVTITWTGACRRCLEPQPGSTAVDIREIFQKVPVEGETYFLDEDQVDIEQMVRETVLLNLPVAPLCGDDCLGPDPQRFPATVAADDDLAGELDEPPSDPRWAALSELKFDE